MSDIDITNAIIRSEMGAQKRHEELIRMGCLQAAVNWVSFLLSGDNWKEGDTIHEWAEKFSLFVKNKTATPVGKKED